MKIDATLWVADLVAYGAYFTLARTVRYTPMRNKKQEGTHINTPTVHRVVATVGGSVVSDSDDVSLTSEESENFTDEFSIDDFDNSTNSSTWSMDEDDATTFTNDVDDNRRGDIVDDDPTKSLLIWCWIITINITYDQRRLPLQSEE